MSRPRTAKRAAHPRARPIYTARHLAALTDAERGGRERALEALSYMRRLGLSMTKATARAFTDPDTFFRWAGTAVTKLPSGRYRPKPIDKLLRPLQVLTTLGVQDLDVTDSRTATWIAAYRAAVQTALRTGQFSTLDRFRPPIRVGKVRYFLEIRRAVLRQYREAEALNYELYRHDT